MVQHFEAEDEDKAQKEGVDWQHAIKRRKDILLEDCAAKSKRLKDEGAHLAEQGRWVMPLKVPETTRVQRTVCGCVSVTLLFVFLSATC